MGAYFDLEYCHGGVKPGMQEKMMAPARVVLTVMMLGFSSVGSAAVSKSAQVKVVQTDSPTTVQPAVNRGQTADLVPVAALPSSVKAGQGNARGWQWPATGAVVRGKNRRGVDILGKRGRPIYAAAAGTVVYSGPGLKGYGKLIVIRHAGRYLSAYGFITQSRFQKGQRVQAGQQIANMGLGPGNKSMLRFEIRRDGQSISPQTLLSVR